LEEILNMGILNHVKCDYPLPLPEEVNEHLELQLLDWSEVEFFTSSDNWSVLDNYEIEEDGVLYVRKKNSTINEDGSIGVIDSGLEESDFTGELLFWYAHEGKSLDYIVEFKALFWKGNLKEIECSDWKKENNANRKKLERIGERQLKRHIEKTKKWWFRALSSYRRVITSIFNIILYILNKIYKWIT